MFNINGRYGNITAVFFSFTSVYFAIVLAEPTYQYNFDGVLESLSGSSYTAIYLPAEVMAKLPQKGRLRVKGFVNQAPISLAIHKSKTSFWFFTIGGPTRKEAKIKIGSNVNVKFNLVDPNVVDIPEELFYTLEQDEEAHKLFYSLTPGAQRSLCFFVTTAKAVDTRIKRALILTEKIKRGELHYQKEKN